MGYFIYTNLFKDSTFLNKLGESAAFVTASASGH